MTCSTSRDRSTCTSRARTPANTIVFTVQVDDVLHVVVSPVANTIVFAGVHVDVVLHVARSRVMHVEYVAGVHVERELQGFVFRFFAAVFTLGRGRRHT